MSKGNFEKSLKLPKILLGWAGIQIFPKKDDRSAAYLTKSCIFYFNLSWLGSAVFGEFCWFIEGLYTEQSFDELCTCMPCFTISVLAIVKFWFLYFNKGVVENVVEKLRAMHPVDDEEELDDAKEERRILKNALKFLNTVTMLFCYSAVPVLSVFSTASILSMVYDYVNTGNTEFKLPFTIMYFFEVSSMTRWMITYFHQVVAMIITSFKLLSTDILFYSFCTYLQMHFRLLCLKFENVVSKNCKTKTRENFKKAVRRHQELIELVEQIELLYSKSTLCNIIFSSLLICLSGFIVTPNSGNHILLLTLYHVSLTLQGFLYDLQFVHDVGAVSSFLTFLFMNLTQISLLCFFGEMLNSASSKISPAVYNNLWYDAETDIKKNVLVVLMRAQKPCKLTAMKFADLNLNALSAILRSSWSYFALLKTMYD